MPCRDYSSDDWGVARSAPQVKEQMDMLARIACKAMQTLEDNGIEDFLLLKDEEVRDWWAAHKEADRKEQARLAEIERRERIKTEALARLSHEEKELLGLIKPTKQSKKKHVKIANPIKPEDVWEVELAEELVDAFDEVAKKINGGRL